MSKSDLIGAIRDIPDFPTPGVIFKDITTLIQDGPLFKEAVDLMTADFRDRKIDQVVCVEARGFIFGAAIAYQLGAGVILIRKAGKLPHRTRKADYALEYGTATVEIHEDALRPGGRVLIVDDLLATGGTLAAAASLVRELGGRIEAVAVLIELDFLKGREKLQDVEIFSLIHY